jgi:pheromone shutdown protein TraB
MCIGDMFSATGKFRFFGGDDTDDTDAAFKMYNETIAPVVVFDPDVSVVDEEYIYKLHFSKRLRHASDMTFDVFMMRDQDMNRTQVDLAKDSGRMMATFHLPNDALAKLDASERAQKNAELIELMQVL